MLATIKVCLVHMPFLFKLMLILVTSKQKVQILVFFVMLDHIRQVKRACLPALAGQCGHFSLFGHAPALPLELCFVSAAPLLAATPPTSQAILIHIYAIYVRRDPKALSHNTHSRLSGR